jgi:hypothetical protein
MTDRDRHFADAARIVDESLVLRVVTGAVTAIGAAVAASKTAEVLKTIRVARPGLLIATACATHALLLQLMPARVAPVKPLAYATVLAFGAFATLAGFITTRSRATATADSSAGTANTRKS